METCLIYITCKDKTEALEISKTLLEERLIACTNIVEGMTSVYRWEGKVVEDQETILMAKTVQVMVEKISQRVVELHSYDLPCVLSLPISAGNPPYLSWIKEEINQEEGGR